MEEKTIDKSILLSWIQLSEKMGIDTSPILAELKISNEESHLPFSKFAFFVRWITDKSGNSNLGLIIGEQSNLAALGIVGQLIQSSNTIHQGLEKAIHFFNLFSTVITLHLEIDEYSVGLVFEVDPSCYEEFPEACNQLIITSMYFSFKEVYFLTLQRYFPTRFSLAFLSESQNELEKLFKCDLAENNKQNSIFFDKKILDEQIVYSDYELMLTLEKLACKRLTEQNNHLKSLSGVVKSVIYALLDPCFPDLRAISNQLNMSERSLQRKLRKENTSYTQLVIDMKKQLARDYLTKNLSVKETSYLLGYSEPSAFINAFSNWYGQSPQNFKTHHDIV